MEDYRSKSFRFGRVELELYEGHGAAAPAPPGLGNLRCYSASYSQTRNDDSNKRPNNGRPVGSSSRSASASSSKGVWGLSDAETQRKRRVAGYRAYAVEGKMKGSLKKSFRWIKDRCSDMAHGLW